jgi:drug/metabolite transporter (DMT)-like permease
MQKKSLAVALSYLMVYIVWGSTYYFIKIAVHTMPPFYVVGFRFLFAGAVFLAIAIATGVLRKMPSVQEILSAFFLGLFLCVLGNGFVSMAERSVDSYLAALTVSATPFCVAFFNRVLFKEKLAMFRLIGMISGLLGVAFVLYNGSNILESFTPGIGYVVAGLACWSLATSVGHKMKVHQNTLVNSGLQMLFAGIVALVASSLLYKPLPKVLPLVSGFSWFGVAYLAIFGGAAFFCYSYLIKHEPSIRIVSYAIVNPLIAVVLGLVFAHEKPARYLIVGFPLILVGLVFMLYGPAIAEKLRKKG